MKITPTNKTNSNFSFKKLETVKYVGNFNLKTPENINLVSSIYKSSGIKDFFSKYDGMIILGKENKSTDVVNFNIAYKELSNSDIFKKLLISIRDISAYKEFCKTINIFKATADDISEKLKTLTLEDIEREISIKRLDFIVNNDKKNKDKNYKENVVIEESLYDYTDLSKKSKILVKKTEKLIEDTWTTIKRQKKPVKNVEFKKRFKNKIVTLKPLYESYKKYIHMEIESPDDIIKITIDRNSFDYKFEKVIKTKFGTAGGKVIDSKKEQNIKAISTINDCLEEYIPKFIRDFQPSEHELQKNLKSIFL